MLFSFPPEIAASIVMFATPSVADYRYYRRMMTGPMIEYYDIEWQRYEATEKTKLIPRAMLCIKKLADFENITEATSKIIIDSNLVAHMPELPKHIRCLSIDNSGIGTFSDEEAQYILSLYPPRRMFMGTPSLIIGRYNMTVQITYVSRRKYIQLRIVTPLNQLPDAIMKLIKEIYISTSHIIRVNVSVCEHLTSIEAPYNNISILDGLQHDKIRKISAPRAALLNGFNKLVELALIGDGTNDLHDLSALSVDRLQYLKLRSIDVSHMPASMPRLITLNLIRCKIEGPICELPRLLTLETHNSEHEVIRAPRLMALKHTSSEGGPHNINYPTLMRLSLNPYSNYIVPDLPKLVTLKAEDATHIRSFPALRHLHVTTSVITIEKQPELRYIRIIAPKDNNLNDVISQYADQAFNGPHDAHPTWLACRILAL
jgi:hypothetical protein